MKIERKEKPIVFCSDMIQALHNGIKSETRRIVAVQPPLDAKTAELSTGIILLKNDEGVVVHEVKPAYVPGDTAWVQESWRVAEICPNACSMVIRYKANPLLTSEILFTPERFAVFAKYAVKPGWQSPYFMPKESARLRLCFNETTAERLCDISEASAKAEGVDIAVGLRTWGDLARTNIYSSAYTELWDKLNSKRGYPWESNPWVLVYKFDTEEQEKLR